jgi:hypothetical protein
MLVWRSLGARFWPESSISKLMVYLAFHCSGIEHFCKKPFDHCFLKYLDWNLEPRWQSLLKETTQLKFLACTSSFYGKKKNLVGLVDVNPVVFLVFIKSIKLDDEAVLEDLNLKDPEMASSGVNVTAVQQAMILGLWWVLDIYDNILLSQRLSMQPKYADGRCKIQTNKEVYCAA